MSDNNVIPKKRWVVSIDGDTQDWVKSTVEELDTTGQGLFEEMLRQFKGQDLTELKMRLKFIKVQEEYNATKEKREYLDNKEKELASQLKSLKTK